MVLIVLLSGDGDSVGIEAQAEVDGTHPVDEVELGQQLFTLPGVAGADMERGRDGAELVLDGIAGV